MISSGERLTAASSRSLSFPGRGAQGGVQVGGGGRPPPHADAVVGGQAVDGAVRLVGLARADDAGDQQARAGGDPPAGSRRGGDGLCGDVPGPRQDPGVVGHRVLVARRHPGDGVRCGAVSGALCGAVTALAGMFRSARIAATRPGGRCHRGAGACGCASQLLGVGGDGVGRVGPRLVTPGTVGRDPGPAKPLAGFSDSLTRLGRRDGCPGASANLRSPDRTCSAGRPSSSSLGRSVRGGRSRRSAGAGDTPRRTPRSGPSPRRSPCRALRAP